MRSDNPTFKLPPQETTNPKYLIELTSSIGLLSTVNTFRISLLDLLKHDAFVWLYLLLIHLPLHIWIGDLTDSEDPYKIPKSVKYRLPRPMYSFFIIININSIHILGWLLNLIKVY